MGWKKWGKRSGHPVLRVFAFVPVLIDCEY